MVVTLEAMTVPPLIGPPCRLFQDNEGRIYNAYGACPGHLRFDGGGGWPGHARP